MRLNLGLFITAIITVLFLGSCTREYTCQCEIVYTGKPGLPDPTVNEYQIKDTRKNAEKICEDNSYSNEEDGIKTVETCQIY